MEGLRSNGSFSSAHRIKRLPNAPGSNPEPSPFRSNMTELENYSSKAVEETFLDPGDTFSEKCAYKSGYKHGWRVCRELLIQELQNIAAQTDDQRVITLAAHFENFGEVKKTQQREKTMIPADSWAASCVCDS